MAKIIRLSPHIANLIAAGEVVERPASVMKELLENAVDAGATQITAEIRDGGMTFLRVTDNGCGIPAEDAPTAFLRHATSKLRQAEDLAAIETMGFRGEALAAIASVSRIDLITKTPEALLGISLQLEAGQLTETTEAGCPDGTTIIVRDLFFNTPARMKFMKTDSVEGSRVLAAVQQQALAHPEVAFRFLRDGKEVLSTPGTGNLGDAAYCVYGKECGKMVQVNSHWDQYTISGYVSKPSDARPSRSMQTFFVNNRPVKSRILIAALEEAYRNQIMVGKFPACVLHLTLPASSVDVNVHPAKTEVKFLNEKAVFDCVHYGVLGALNKAPDRPQVQFKAPQSQPPVPPSQPAYTEQKAPAKQKEFFRTMTPEEYKTFAQAVQSAPQPKPAAAAATAAAVTQAGKASVHSQVLLPSVDESVLKIQLPKVTPPAETPKQTVLPTESEPEQTVLPTESEPEQTVLPMPEEIPWRLVGELYNSYILVEQGQDAYLIDKHAAHERILFEKLKATQEAISSQALLTPQTCRLAPENCAVLLSNKDMLEDLGFEIDEFGANTILIRQVPMDLVAADAPDALESISADLLNGRRENRDSVRDSVLHTVACKAAIKAGWRNDEKELLALAKEVMANEDLKHCPHGRPICISLSKAQLEKQFKRT